jgi:GntR family transcriptional regulator, histidine utilization repressor
MSRVTEKAAEIDHESGVPLYAKVKRMILGNVRSGAWPPRHRIPSETELTEELGVSRMTVNRALRELSIEGVLLRMQGLGSFVAEGKQPSAVFEVRSIAEEIVGRGNVYSATIVLLDRLRASPEIADALDVPIESEVFHSIIVHKENEIAIQLEARYVNPKVAPHYIDQNFEAITPTRYLTEIAAWTEAEHQVEAVLPASWESRLLLIARADPCLLVRRRTWVGPDVATSVRLLFPGGRYRIESRQRSASASFVD